MIFKGVWTASETRYTKELGQETQHNLNHFTYDNLWDGMAM